MKQLHGKGSGTAEYLFVGVYLAVYAVLLLVSDPEWVMWAGPITLGAFPVAAPKVFPVFEPMEIFQAASYMVLPGLLALIILVRTRSDARSSRRIPAPESSGEKQQGRPHGIPEHREAA